MENLSAGKSRGKSNALLPSVYTSSPVYLSPTSRGPVSWRRRLGVRRRPSPGLRRAGRRRRAPARYALPSPPLRFASLPSSPCETEHPEPYCKLFVLGSSSPRLPFRSAHALSRPSFPSGDDPLGSSSSGASPTTSIRERGMRAHSLPFLLRGIELQKPDVY